MNDQTIAAVAALRAAFDIGNLEAYLAQNPKAVGDLICNLMHFCKFHKIDFEEQLNYARNHGRFEDVNPW